MKRKISFLMLFFVFYAKAQNNNTAVNSGYWNSNCTWDFPAAIYNNTSSNPSEYVKTIQPDVTVIQNLPEVYTNKIILSNNSKVYLVDSDHKIFFTGTGSPIATINECGFGYLDYAVVNFGEHVEAKSLSGFLQGLARHHDDIGTYDFNSYNSPQDRPSNNEISPLRPKLMRQWNPKLYQRAYDLSRNLDLNPASEDYNKGRVHMITSDSWAWWKENYYAPPGTDQAHQSSLSGSYGFIPTDVVTADRWEGWPLAITPNALFDGPANYRNFLKTWFSWGKYDESWDEHSATSIPNLKPGIVWECWNEPDIHYFWKPADTIAGSSTTNPPGSKWDSANDRYWPDTKRNEFYATYKAFYKEIRNPVTGVPDAKVAGPSIGIYSNERIKDFLDFCLNNKDENGNPDPLEVNVVTWHELGLDMDKPIKQVKDHIKFVRDLITSSKYTPLHANSIEINEIVTDNHKNNPAAIASYLGYLEQAGADYAAKSCWPDESHPAPYPDCVTDCVDCISSTVFADSSCFACSSNTLDHLFNADGDTKAAWWTYKFYADGVKTRVKSTNIEPHSIIIPSKNIIEPSLTPYAQVLFGYSDIRNWNPCQPDIVGQLPPMGTYKIQLNEINAVIPGAILDTPCYVKIKEIPNPLVCGNITGNNVELLNPVTVYSHTYLVNNENSVIVEWPDVKREYLYQMIISGNPIP